MKPLNPPFDSFSFRANRGWFAAALFTLSSILTYHADCQDPVLPGKVNRQLGELVQAFNNRQPQRFVSLSKELLNRSSSEGIQNINRELAKRKLPSIEEMVAHVRINAIKSNVNLPAPSWNEFRGMVPAVSKLLSETISEFEKNPLSRPEVSSPDEFSEYQDMVWELHVFHNQMKILAKVAKETEFAKSKFSRQLDKFKKQLSDEEAKAYSMNLATAAKKLERLLMQIEEREAEIRILRVDDAHDFIVSNKPFADQFDAAFALAFDHLFFNEFVTAAKNKKREFQNADLNDPSIFEIVDQLVDSAKTKNPNLFEKATLFYVGSHWWLRGRYGQGPLANGLLKAEEAAENEDAKFPLFMPTQMPDIDQLVGDRKKRPVIRRHEFIWSLGNEGIESMNLSGSQTTMVATLDRFY